jgi:hypothetical protein
MNPNLLTTIFNGVAMALGIAVVVINTIGSMEPVSAMTMLGLAVAALGIANLQGKRLP